MNGMRLSTALIVFIVLWIVFSSFYTVTQGEHGILLRLGRVVDSSVTRQPMVINPGLHVKKPFIESVKIFDTRLQTLDIKSSRIVTREKKDVIVDYYVKWQIQNLARYYKSTGGDDLKAKNLLEQQLNTSLRAEFGKRDIVELISSIRDDVMELMIKNAEKQAIDLGIHVVDVRIKGIELPENTSNAIYQRMRADMQKIANRHRADGKAAANAIQAQADAIVTISLAKAKSEGQRLRAEGISKAAGIYAEAYQKNPQFFRFYRSLQAYMDSFNSKQDVFVLDLNSSFFDYFKQPLRVQGK